MKMPTIINSFNVYNRGNNLVGVSGEVKMPDLESKTVPINGTGIMGDFDETVMGQFNSMKMEIPFRTLSGGIFAIMDPTKLVEVTLRGAIQCIETTTAVSDLVNMRVVVRGKMIKFTPGAVKAAEQMNCSVTLEVTYMLVELDGRTMLEVDKLNSVYVIDGMDIMKKVRSLC